MVKVQCIKCSREGSLTKKQTKSKGKTYKYWYVEHHIRDKIKWCYLGKYEKLPEEYKRLIHKDTQTDTQNLTRNLSTKQRTNNLNSRIIHRIEPEKRLLFWARGLVRINRRMTYTNIYK